MYEIINTTIRQQAGKKRNVFFLLTLCLYGALFFFTAPPAEAATLTLSGTVYEADRLTPYATSSTITLAVATTTVSTFSTTTATTTGTFTFSVEVGTIATSTPLTVFIDGNAALKAVTITKTSGTTTVTDLKLYKNHVTFSNEAAPSVGTSTKATDLFPYDSTKDSDILFTASSTLGRLTVEAGQTLFVAASTTFHMDLPTVADHFENATTATTLASSTMSLTGNFTQNGIYATAGASSTTWTSRTSAANNNWTSVTYGKGLFVAVAEFGTNRVMTSPDSVTWTSRTVTANDWQSVTYGNGIFVAVSDTGTGNRVVRSSDGITWATSTSAADNAWNSVTYGNGLFVAVAGSGTGNRVMTSPDGITWTSRTSAADNTWTSVTYGNGLFVAVSRTGTGNCVMTSPDGITWTSRTSAADNYWYSVTYGNGLFVAVGDAPYKIDYIMTSSDGITWTSRTASANQWWQSVTYGNGLFVAVSRFGNINIVMTSPDGITWTSRTTAAYNDWYSVTYGNGLFVAVSSTGSGNRVMTSAGDNRSLFFTGTTTQNITGTLTATSTLPSVVFQNSGTKTFTSNASTSDFTVATSSGTVTAPAALTLTGNFSNSNTFIAPSDLYFTGATEQSATGTMTGTSTFNNLLLSEVGVKTFMSNASTSNLTIATSSTFNAPPKLTIAGNYTNSGVGGYRAATWTSRTSAATNYWQSVTYGNGLFVAVAGSGTGNRVMTSPDGITWTSRTSAADNTWTSVTYGNGLFVAVSRTGTGNRVMTSPDGITWTSRTSAADNAWYSVTYGNGLFVAVAYNSVMTSPDGITWTSRTASYASSWTSVTYGNGLFVAVSTDAANRVMTSPDGITWTSRTAAVNSTWNSVTYGNGLFVAVASIVSSNSVMTSPDGVTWTSRNAASDSEWQSVTYGNGLFVAVAQADAGNRVMTSPDGITWTSRTSTAASNYWQSVTYGDGLFVAVGFSASSIGRVMTSGSEVIFSGTSTQSIGGSLTGESAFNNVVFTGIGEKTISNLASTTNLSILTTATTTFNNSLTVADHLSIPTPNATLVLAANASTTMGSTTITGTEGSEVKLRSTTPGSKFGFMVTGGYGITYVDVKDSNASSTSGLVNALGIDSGNNSGWSFAIFGITLADGSTLPDTIAYPSGLATTTSRFTLVTSYGTSTTVTALSLALQTASATSGIERIEITSADGATVYGSTTNPTTSPITITLDTNVLTVTTSSTEYLIKITPKSHAAMPAAPGDEYAVSTRVSDWTSAGYQFNNSTYGRTVTIDNLSPTLPTSTPAVLYAEDFEGADLGIAVSSGDVLWDTDTSSVNSGTYSAKAGAITDLQTTSLEFTYDITEPGAELYFSRRTSTESGWDYFYLYIDDVMENGWSGEFAWSEVGPYALATGTHAIRFAYEKDESVLEGEDTAWVDDIEIRYPSLVPTATSTPEISAIVSYLTTSVTDYSSSLILMSTSTITDVPSEGNSYTLGEAVGSSTVACIDTVGLTATTSSCSILDLIPGEIYNFKVFSRDLAGNYSNGITYSGFVATTTTASSSSSLSIASAAAHFYVGQATTTLGTVTITEDATTPSIASTTDIRIVIATTTTNFRFNTNTTTLTFEGTANGKVASTVSYENDGATLVIDVTSNFTASDTLMISDIAVGSFASVSAAGYLTLQTDGNNIGTPAATDTATIHITGSLILADHTLGQVSNEFSFQNKTDTAFFAFNLEALGENATVTDLVITLAGVQGISTNNFSNFRLYRDNNSDLQLDGGDTVIDAAGVVTINGQVGAITFSSDFIATTSADCIMIGNTSNIGIGESVVLSLASIGITAVGDVSLYSPVIINTTESIQHHRGGTGAGGSTARIGVAAPAGAGVVTGGGNGGGGGADTVPDGANITPDTDFFKPTTTGSPDNEWTNGTNAYDSDGVYATAASTNLKQSYANFGFGIPTGNTIQGLSVKLDVSGTTADGTIDVSISWDGGSSYTTAKATPTVSGSDLVYIVGGNADTWGRTWSTSEFSAENFRLRVSAQPAANTIRLDALEIRIYHQTGGGGAGGGAGGGRI